jgi:hypothetical protein
MIPIFFLSLVSLTVKDKPTEQRYGKIYAKELEIRGLILSQIA